MRGTLRRCCTGAFLILAVLAGGCGGHERLPYEGNFDATLAWDCPQYNSYTTHVGATIFETAAGCDANKPHAVPVGTLCLYITATDTPDSILTYWPADPRSGPSTKSGAQFLAAGGEQPTFFGVVLHRGTMTFTEIDKGGWHTEINVDGALNSLEASPPSCTVHLSADKR